MKANDVDVAHNNKHFYIGGTSTSELAVLKVLELNSDMKEIDCMEFSESGDNSIYCARVAGITRTVICATYSNIYLVNFASKKLNLMTKLLGIHVGVDPITDVVMKKNLLFSCATHDDSVRVVKFEFK